MGPDEAMQLMAHAVHYLYRTPGASKSQVRGVMARLYAAASLIMGAKMMSQSFNAKPAYSALATRLAVSVRDVRAAEQDILNSLFCRV